MELLKLLASFSHWNVGIRPFEASSSIYREGWLLPKYLPLHVSAWGAMVPLLHFITFNPDRGSEICPLSQPLADYLFQTQSGLSICDTLYVT